MARNKSKPAPKMTARRVVKKQPKCQKAVQYEQSSAEPRSIGNRVGSAIGGFVGDYAQKAFKLITGLGAYQVQSNTLVGNGDGIPQFLQRGAGIELVHREFIQDVTGTVDFLNAIQKQINPGLAGTFPWLSRLAINFEEYQFKGLVFEFKSTSATAIGSTNTALGVVIMATNYDSKDLAFATKQQMEAYEFSCSTKPADSMIHPVECMPNKNVLNTLYVRNDATDLTNSDIRMYDLGEFQLATSGMQAAATIGELWVSYHVCLKKPKLNSPLGGPDVPSIVFTTPSSLVKQTTPLPGRKLRDISVSDPLFGCLQAGSLDVTRSSFTRSDDIIVSELTFNIPGKYLLHFRALVGDKISGSPTWTDSEGGSNADVLVIDHVSITADDGADQSVMSVFITAIEGSNKVYPQFGPFCGAVFGVQVCITPWQNDLTPVPFAGGSILLPNKGVPKRQGH